MLTALAAAAVVASGVHPAAVVVAVLAVYRPGWFLAAAAGWALRHRMRRRDPGPGEEAALLHAVSAELRAGASLRTALAAAAARAPALPLAPTVRLAAAGRPGEEVARALAAALPRHGRLAGAAFRLATTTGAGAAGVFAALAVRAAAAGDLQRERRVLTAQARYSALVVGGAPLVLGALVLGTGTGASLLAAGSTGRALIATGLGLEIAGWAAIWALARDPGP